MPLMWPWPLILKHRPSPTLSTTKENGMINLRTKEEFSRFEEAWRNKEIFTMLGIAFIVSALRWYGDEQRGEVILRRITNL